YVFFGADNMEFVSRDMYKSGTLHIVITKHPLFIITLPLYDAASKLYAWVPGFLQHNLIVAFPFALLGACNISVSFWTFMRNYANWQAALGFALLYGLSTATWFFSSFPETYVLTALCTTLFLGLLLPQTERPLSVPLIAGVHALVCYSAPQQIFL